MYANFILILLIVQYDATKPNIIIMFMDDMGWGDLGVNGHPAQETTNLDKMAAEGIKFQNFYSASPICSCSRASLMTGRLPVRNGFYTDNKHGANAYTPQNVVGGISTKEILLPELLKKAGYKSKIIGKWHMGHQQQHLPLNRGFDEFFGSPNCHFAGHPHHPVYRNNKMIGRYYDDFPVRYKSNFTQWFIEEALVFIEKEVKADNPFLLYWTPDATHAPAYASDMFLEKSARGGSYGDAVMELDYGVGLILDKLKELKIENNSFVFFTSDNGGDGFPRKGNQGDNGPFLCSKLSTFEGGMREPGIGWWPGTIPPGLITKQLTTTMDLMVTAVKLAGINLPSDRIYDGIDLTSVLKGGDVIDQPVYYYRGNEMYAVRVGDYKAHYWTWAWLGGGYCPGQYVAGVTTGDQVNQTESPLLFHLYRDPGEKYPIDQWSRSYKKVMKTIRPIVDEHKRTMVMGEPQLNWCDNAVKNWAPNGCDELNSCQDIPESNPTRCSWGS